MHSISVCFTTPVYARSRRAGKGRDAFAPSSANWLTSNNTPESCFYPNNRKQTNKQVPSRSSHSYIARTAKYRSQKSDSHTSINRNVESVHTKRNPRTMPAKPAFIHPVPFRTSHRRPHLAARTSPTMAAKLNIGDVSEKLGPAISALAADALATKPRFTLAISGGSLPKLLAAAIPGHDLSAWRAYLADERIVPLDHPDSNYKEIVARLPGLHVVPAATDLPPPACAQDYEGKIEEFDVVLLGLGPDGHTCSLFPEHPLVS